MTPFAAAGPCDQVMNTDISTRQDIELLLSEFYKVAIPDPELLHHFVDLDLVTHMPVIVDFWEKILFNRPVYFGNPLMVHERLHQKSPLEPEHFARWVEIFRATVDSLFEGEVAERAKQVAGTIAQSLNQRLSGGVAIKRGA